jgi:hypothetical protein
MLEKSGMGNSQKTGIIARFILLALTKEFV